MIWSKNRYIKTQTTIIATIHTGQEGDNVPTNPISCHRFLNTGNVRPIIHRNGRVGIKCCTKPGKNGSEKEKSTDKASIHATK
ncbi:hypothetical protein [Thermoactinomyces mirandus]|uniref:hypothetical protein n=1 Tax=Thermoactinomyces mirandus TaxID=2756294 RepID=UPI0015EE513E|nr:hypothetical protein [Thermoactinomyces mirandus]